MVRFVAKRIQWVPPKLPLQGSAQEAQHHISPIEDGEVPWPARPLTADRGVHQASLQRHDALRQRAQAPHLRMHAQISVRPVLLGGRIRRRQRRLAVAYRQQLLGGALPASSPPAGSPPPPPDAAAALAQTCTGTSTHTAQCSPHSWGRHWQWQLGYVVTAHPIQLVPMSSHDRGFWPPNRKAPRRLLGWAAAGASPTASRQQQRHWWRGIGLGSTRSLGLVKGSIYSGGGMHTFQRGIERLSLTRWVY